MRCRTAASPFLVFGAKGTKLRVQATNLKETVGAIDGFQDLADDGILAGLRLVPVADNTYDEGKDYAKGERRGAIGEKAVQLALKYLGIPYVWGGATPAGGFDCSGLVMYVYGKLGMRLHHFTGLQWLEGTRIDASHAGAGRHVFFRPEAGHPGHEGMYIGGGKFIQAPHTGDVVKISDLAGYAGNYVGAVRPYWTTILPNCSPRSSASSASGTPASGTTRSTTARWPDDTIRSSARRNSASVAIVVPMISSWRQNRCTIGTVPRSPPVAPAFTRRPPCSSSRKLASHTAAPTESTTRSAAPIPARTSRTTSPER